MVSGMTHSTWKRPRAWPSPRVSPDSPGHTHEGRPDSTQPRSAKTGGSRGWVFSWAALVYPLPNAHARACGSSTLKCFRFPPACHPALSTGLSGDQGDSDFSLVPLPRSPSPLWDPWSQQQDVPSPCSPLEWALPSFTHPPGSPCASLRPDSPRHPIVPPTPEPQTAPPPMPIPHPRACSPRQNRLQFPSVLTCPPCHLAQRSHPLLSSMGDQ